MLSRSFLLMTLVLVTQSWSQAWLSAPRVPPATPNGPAGSPLAVVDLDGDGDKDILKYTWWGGQPTIQVSWNSGTGDFTDGATQSLPAGVSWVTAFGDVTGDGIGDLVLGTPITNPSGASLMVMPGLGGGLFGAPVVTPFSEDLVSIALADLNADGRLDAAVVSEVPGTSRTLRWFVSGANGALVGGTPGALPFNSSSAGVVTIDWNADGTLDALVGTYLPGWARVMIAFPTVGTGFGTPTTVPVSAAPFLHRADVNGDGLDDVIAWNESAGTATSGAGISVQVSRNLGGGNWTIGPSQTFLDANGSQLHPGDWDGDGDLDLALTTWQGTGEIIILLENTGGTTFVSRTSFYAGPSSDYDRIPAMVDVSGDGKPDIVSSAALYYGDGTFTNPYASTISSNLAHSILDQDGDGDLDMVGYSGNVAQNDGRGNFTPTLLTMPTPPAGLEYAQTHPVADLNGDGRIDHVATLQTLPSFPLPAGFVGMRLLVDTGAGALFDLQPAAAPGAGGLAGIPADVDGDGDVDLVGPLLWTNNGTGFFTSSTPSYFGGVPKAAADLDGDGDTDFVALQTAVPGYPNVVILRNANGALALNPVVTGNSLGSSNPNDWYAPVIADLDDDGDLDIALDDRTSDECVTILANNGGTFTFATTITLTAGSVFNPLLSASDVDGDGKTDIVAGSVWNTVAVLRRIGPGFVYEARRDYFLQGFTATADIDADGDLDFVGAGKAARSRRFAPPTAGRVRQYGSGTLGGSAWKPLLGASGTMRAGAQASLRLRNGIGGAAAVIVIGTGEAAIAGSPLPGLTSYVQPWTGFVPLTLGGSPGAPGAGSATTPFTVPASLVNQSVFLQFGATDGLSPGGITVSNGLELHVGP